MTFFPRACRACGCTDNDACITEQGPCWWIDADLCSACTARRPQRPFLTRFNLLCGALILSGVIAALWVIAR